MITGVVSDMQLTVDLTNICWMNITYDDLMRPAKPHWKLLKNSWKRSCFLWDFTRWWHRSPRASRRVRWRVGVTTVCQHFQLENVHLPQYHSGKVWYFFWQHKISWRYFCMFHLGMYFLASDVLRTAEDIVQEIKKHKQRTLNSKRYQLKYGKFYWSDPIINTVSFTYPIKICLRYFAKYFQAVIFLVHPAKSKTPNKTSNPSLRWSSFSVMGTIRIYTRYWGAQG